MTLQNILEDRVYLGVRLNHIVLGITEFLQPLPKEWKITRKLSEHKL